jgi:hypothetical protein
MNATAIEDVLGKRPFQPFLIQFDGAPVRVDHPEQALFNATRTVLIVAAPDDRIHLLDVAHIKAITLAPRRRRTPAG